MRTHLLAWLLLLLALFAAPAFAQDEADDLFGEPAEAAGEKAAEATKEPARKLHTRGEIKAELVKQNGAIAAQMAKFVELNKQVAKQAIDGGNKDELMPILREYGPAVIRTKQLWTTVVGNPAKYDTWLGSADYWKAWVAFHNNWKTLYGYTDRFAAVDMDLADKLSDGLATLGTSFEDYNMWVDEWDRELGNDTHSFARGDEKMNELDREQMREEEGADDETAQAFEDQEKEEEDATAPSDVEEAQQDTEEADKEELAEGEESADEAADEAADEETMEEENAVEGEEPAEEEPLFGDEAEEGAAEEETGEEAAEEEVMEEEAPAEGEAGEEGAENEFEETLEEEEAPAEEEEMTEEEAGEEETEDAETEEAPAEESDEEGDDLFGDE